MNDMEAIMRAELAAIYTRTLGVQRPPNAATALERARLRAAAHELTTGRRSKGVA